MANSTNKTNDPIEIANKFNEYFINVGPKLADKIINTTNTTFNNYLDNKNSMFLDPITEFELETELRNMKQNKCPGYDNITTKTVITCAK